MGNILIKSPITGERKSLTQSEFFSYMAQTNGEILKYVISEEVDKHGDHDQSSHGNRDGGASGEDGLSQETAAKIQQFTREWGGLSIKMTDGSMPDKGFMVSKPTSLSRVVPAKDFYDAKEGWKIMREYQEKHSQDLATGKNYLGTWENEGKVFLDVSQNIMDRNEATSLGQSRDQLKIWDVVNQKEIDTGGTGGIKKASSDGGMEGHLGNDRGREGRLRKGTLGKIDWHESRRTTKVIYFDYGLKPVLKHEGGPDHTQDTHGSWATGRSAEDVKRISEFKDRGPTLNLLNEALEGGEPEIDRDKARLLIENEEYLNDEVEDRINSLIREIEEQDGAPMSEMERMRAIDEYRNQVVEEYIDQEPDFLENYSQMNDMGSILDPQPIDALKESLNDVYGLETTATFRGGERQGETITLTSTVDEVTRQGNILRVVTNITDDMGNQVNDDEIIRYFEKNEETGTWSAEHNFLKINEEYRGLGFGSKFLQQSEDYYVAKGLTHITLNAGLEDGARHWANSGFDWNRDKLDFSVKQIDNFIKETERRANLDYFTDANDNDISLSGEAKQNLLQDLGSARTLLNNMRTPDGPLKDMKNDNFPKPRDFASLGANRPITLEDGTKTYSGKILLTGKYLPYMKILTAEGQNLLSGPVDMDGDGLVYDGTPREKPVSSVGKK